VIAVQGPRNSLQVYWQPIGSQQWNRETVAGPGSAFSAPSVAQVGDSTVIAVQGPNDQGPNDTLLFFWQPIGSQQWNQENVLPGLAVSAEPVKSDETSGCLGGLW
jgi:hypothetical protein